MYTIPYGNVYYTIRECILYPTGMYTIQYGNVYYTIRDCILYNTGMYTIQYGNVYYTLRECILYNTGMYTIQYENVYYTYGNVYYTIRECILYNTRMYTIQYGNVYYTIRECILYNTRMYTIQYDMYGVEYILEESIFDIRYFRLYHIDIPKERWLDYLQTVETLIRRRVLRRLIWICTICRLGVSSLQWVKSSRMFAYFGDSFTCLDSRISQHI